MPRRERADRFPPPRLEELGLAVQAFCGSAATSKLRVGDLSGYATKGTRLVGAVDLPIETFESEETEAVPAGHDGNREHAADASGHNLRAFGSASERAPVHVRHGGRDVPP